MVALSIATDLGMGQPITFASQSCMLALRLAERLGFGPDNLRATYYQALLRYIGCNAETRMLAAIFGDELAMRRDIIHQDPTDPNYLVMLARFIQAANAGKSPLRVAYAVVSGMAEASRETGEFFAGHCEVAHRLATRLGLAPPIAEALRQVYARWDGRGIPALKGEAVAPSMLVVSLAQDALYSYQLGGLAAATDLVRRRSGTLYAPEHCEVFAAHAHSLLPELEADFSWDTLVAVEPGRPLFLHEDALVTACEAIADFADIKSPYTLGHSTGVARIATRAAQLAGMPDGDVQILRAAALLHDIGRVGVSAGIWVKPGPLNEREWEQVRLHPYYSERILARPRALSQLGAIAGLHHERLDGSGYHRGTTSVALPPLARLLAVADVYQALTEERPHRAAHSPDQASELIMRQARQGLLDSDSAAHVLAAAGQRQPTRRRELVAGLSERELEVLRLLARGLSMRQIAERLVIAPKTVDNHTQRIYAKINVTTRAGATLFAMEHQLLIPEAE